MTSVRHLLLPMLLVALCAAVHAQPAPPDFCFVISEPGDADKPLSRGYVVKQQYRERVFYYNSDRYWLKPDTIITLGSRDLFKEQNNDWRVFTPIAGVAESRLLVITGTDTMKIDLPDDLRPLIDRAWQRWPEPSPEVMRFKPGRTWDVNTCINEYQAGVAANQYILRRLQQEAGYVPPPANIPPPGIRPPTPLPPVAPIKVQARQDRKMPPPAAEQPRSAQVMVARVNADTVWLRITGRVMLDGGCASNRPLFGIEQLADTGWVERIPFDLTQMDCGMPWANWEDHVVMLPPLRWWIGAHQPEGQKEMRPGSYRIVLMGGNMRALRTERFEVR